jgi:hypothetical protein
VQAYLRFARIPHHIENTHFSEFASTGGWYTLSHMHLQCAHPPAHTVTQYMHACVYGQSGDLPAVRDGDYLLGGAAGGGGRSGGGNAGLAGGRLGNGGSVGLIEHLQQVLLCVVIL